MHTSREAHVAWAKARALASCEAGDHRTAFASLLHDLEHHAETKEHRGIAMAMTLALPGRLNTVEEMRTFIEGLH